MSEAPRIVLASQSPRRADLLGRLGLEFTVEPADIDEGYPEHEMPATYAERLAREKAISVAHRHHDALVVGSDTIVVLDSDVLGKPKDEADAVRMLNRLSGREHEVFTAVAAVLGGRVESSVERVSVRFRALDDREIEAYVATGEPLDKAGAYAIQGRAGVFVRHLAGSYTGVMGLPLYETAELLESFGLSLP